MKRIFVLYRDKYSPQYEGDAWNAQSFGNWEDADEFIADLQSPTSAWSDSAVTYLVTELEVPVALCPME